MEMSSPRHPAGNLVARAFDFARGLLGESPEDLGEHGNVSGLASSDAPRVRPIRATSIGHTIAEPLHATKATNRHETIAKAMKKLTIANPCDHWVCTVKSAS